MKIYFEKTNGNNNMIITDGLTAKVYDAAPSGIYEGVDLYSENAAEQLAEKFKAMDEAGELNGYNEIYCRDEMGYNDVKEEIEAAELVFESDQL